MSAIDDDGRNLQPGRDQPEEPTVELIGSTIDLRLVETSWRGPLPPPALLREYEEIIPGSAERILQAFESEQSHVQRMETAVIEGDSKRSAFGLAAGFIIAVLGISGGIYLGLQGYQWLGGVIAGVPLTGLVGVFIYGSRERRAERDQNAADASK